jgi:phosphoserine phosphatase RsbU/P
MLENARLTDRVVEQEKLRRDVALAGEVQRRLLPDKPPNGTATGISAVSLPARIIGGDYYDFIDTGDHRIGIALADVAGKGVAAALIMSVVHASLRIISSENGITLPQIAAKLNKYLHQLKGGTSSYATFFYAQIDEQTRQLRYVNAGHNPPYLLRKEEIQELTAGGTVIGMFPHMAYDEAAVELQSGDLLVAFTDGVPEAQNPAEEEFGEERLKDLLRKVAHLPVQEISAHISTELKNWIKDAAQYDDLTFIVMKVN